MQLVNAEAGKKFTSYQVFVIVLLSLTQFTVILDFMIISPLALPPGSAGSLLYKIVKHILWRGMTRSDILPLLR
jgi:hypothetical protein